MNLRFILEDILQPLIDETKIILNLILSLLLLLGIILIGGMDGLNEKFQLVNFKIRN